MDLKQTNNSVVQNNLPEKWSFAEVEDLEDLFEAYDKLSKYNEAEIFGMIVQNLTYKQLIIQPNVLKEFCKDRGVEAEEYYHIYYES